MPKPRKKVPLNLRLSYNPHSGYYETFEDGILYQMNIELTRSLKDFFKYQDATVSEWYSTLRKAEKKIVNRIGNVPDIDTGFKADIIYED